LLATAVIAARVAASIFSSSAQAIVADKMAAATRTVKDARIAILLPGRLLGSGA
jgi:aspartokinase-like uncharacterized kinase